jgi:hypothetical protein
MPQTLEVHVTQEDIDKGVPLDCHRCAISRAIKRQYGEVYTRTGKTSLTVAASKEIDSPLHLYKQTIRGRRFIEKFDNGKKVEPTSFRFPYVGM